MKNLFVFLALFVLTFHSFSQEKTPDSTKTQVLDEILVKAVRVNADSPITHSNVTKKALEKRNLGQDLPILLNYLPSVVTTSDAGSGVGYTGIRVRGVSSQSTNITINGIPYNDAESLGTFWVDLPDFASSVESLQLQRGVGTSTNGSGAFGASINILTDAIAEKANAEISNSFGSYQTRKHHVKFSTGTLNNHFELAGRLSQINSDGYIDRATSDLKAYFLQASYIDDNTLIKALAFGGHEITYQAWNGIDAETLATNRTFNPSGLYTDNEGNIQFHEDEVDNYKQDHYQLHWNEMYNNQWSTNLGLNYTYGRGYFEQYKEDEAFSDYDLTELNIGGEIINTTDLIRRRWLDNDFYVLNFNANYKTNTINFTFGTSYSSYIGNHFGEIIWARFASNSEIGDTYYNGKGKKKDFSFFAKATYRLNDRISLYGDLQTRFVSYKTTGLTSDRVNLLIDETYNFFNPKAGITYKLNQEHSLYFSYARANREPSRSDFESNPDIKTEQLNDFELGWRHQSNKIKLNTNLYYMFYNEQLVLSGAIDNTGTPIRANSGESYRLGLEIEATFQISKQFVVQPNVTVSSNKNRGTFSQIDGVLVDLGKTNISFSPELVAANALVFQPSNNFQTSFLSKYVGEQFMGNSDSQASKLDSYFVNDLNITYEIKPKALFKSITLSGLINNVFGVEYVSNGYYFTFDDTWSDPNQITTIEGAGYYPQATTNFLLGATLKF
ncbi:MAG: TonB-dependent receptor [Flavobacteriales bacterium]|nr:TonB-dependent receptor [Flavobacteriia bacterium]NCP05508.1 TonB-dependent receptor [Flavobacteriales bacterium]PIV92399.1 MAG: TonB-dependent receptor [Flavobacteriaceae bacterium CG17_big_fil_post_rev_8_21_14_2_50_33_15]PIY11797.1 MAG: TonB-dependent receptor [Flavobacteriaceae bacterium CG_4_10_14_3_um_filter_33_47]PJB16758.1 MAG: TonB-dependent receptor [Flavobacteriaceae bacterium CG_4_9_14_3_um_filter_33_16]